MVALAAHAFIGLGWTTALLLGAAVSSTDAAAVFAALRGTHVRRKVAAVLEAESGLNDPFAALLVIGLVEWSTSDFGTGDGLLLLVRQAGIGALGGLRVGAAGVWLLRRLPLPSAGLAPVITVAIALAGAVGVSRLDGSGLLAAYLIGLVIGDARIPHAAVVRGFLQGAAWLAQLGLFVLLGLLVTPSRVLDEGLGPILVADRARARRAPAGGARVRDAVRAVAARAGLPGLGRPARRRAHRARDVSRRRRRARGEPRVRRRVLRGRAVGGRAGPDDALGCAHARPDRGAPRAAARRDGLGDPLHAALRAASSYAPRISASAPGTLVRDAELPGAAIIVAIRRDLQIVRPRGSSELAGDDHLYLLVASDRLRDVQAALDLVETADDAPHSGVNAPFSG